MGASSTEESTHEPSHSNTCTFSLAVSQHQRTEDEEETEFEEDQTMEAVPAVPAVILLTSTTAGI